MRVIIYTAFALLIGTSTSGHTSEKHHQHTSKYSGQESRNIKSLSLDDITELRRGGGWGLAKAAELNGVPGPIHLLELKDEILLTESQVSEIEALYQSMKSQAKKLGQQLIALEQELELEFQNRTVTEQSLMSLLTEISSVRRDLRYAHLATHLRTPDILSETQIAKYNVLRGYSDLGGPCASVPKGHNAKMWRKHNGCE